MSSALARFISHFLINEQGFLASVAKICSNTSWCYIENMRDVFGRKAMCIEQQALLLLRRQLLDSVHHQFLSGDHLLKICLILVQVIFMVV